MTLSGDTENDVALIEAFDIPYPLILRRAGTQTGITMQLIKSAQEAAAYCADMQPDTRLNVIEYIDIRDAEGYYRKTRAFFIDGAFFPVANLVNDNWQIHSGDRYRVMSDHAAAQEREREYLNDPKAYLGDRTFAALHAIRDDFDLDFFGVDFCQMPDGTCLVFEANAAMRHNFDHAANFPYTRPYLEDISRAFMRMTRRKTQ